MVRFSHYYYYGLESVCYFYIFASDVIDMDKTAHGSTHTNAHNIQRVDDLSVKWIQNQMKIKGTQSEQMCTAKREADKVASVQLIDITNPFGFS